MYILHLYIYVCVCVVTYVNIFFEYSLFTPSSTCFLPRLWNNRLLPLILRNILFPFHFFLNHNVLLIYSSSFSLSCFLSPVLRSIRSEVRAARWSACLQAGQPVCQPVTTLAVSSDFFVGNIFERGGLPKIRSPSFSYLFWSLQRHHSDFLIADITRTPFFKKRKWFSLCAGETNFQNQGFLVHYSLRILISSLTSWQVCLCRTARHSSFSMMSPVNFGSSSINKLRHTFFNKNTPLYLCSQFVFLLGFLWFVDIPPNSTSHNRISSWISW